MADETQGPISSSRMGAENGSRKSQGLPPLTMEEYVAQLSGAAPATTPAGSQVKAAEPTPVPQAPETTAAPNPTNAAPAAPVQKLSPSRFASENAYRKKMGMPLLTPEEAGLSPAGEAAAAPAAPTQTATSQAEKASAAPPAARPAAAAPTQPPPSAAATV